MTRGEPGSSSRATGSPVLGSGTSSEPTPMGCPPRPPLPQRPRRPRLLPGPTEGSLQDLARVAATRSVMEPCRKTKGETGLAPA
jgi:hypothetical protein